MTNRAKAVTWAVIIIAAAFLTQSQGLSDAASYGVIAGLTGAAWGTVHSRRRCGRGCSL